MTHGSELLNGRIDRYGTPSHSEWLDVDWKRQRRSVEVRGSRVNYVEMGEGPPVAFVHGLTGCWQNWLENIPFFARSHLVVAVDLPGFGRSELPREEISISGYGHLPDAFLGQIGVVRTALVGSSMGGFVAAETAASYPRRAGRLVLVSAPGLGARRPPIQVEDTRDLGRPLLARLAPLGRGLVRIGAARRLMLARLVRHPDRIGKEIIYQCAADAGKPGVRDALRSTLTSDFREGVRSIVAPTLLVWGGSDRVVPASVADRYERMIPGATKVIFPDTGHAPMLERPALFNELVGRFLAEA